jgi:hypothetical protein
VRAPRPFSLELEVAGEPRELIDGAVGWLLRGDTAMKRVRSGGDASLKLDGKLIENRAILAGTDARFTLALVASRGGTEMLRDAKEWNRERVNSGLPSEEEHMVVEAVTWALGRAAATLAEEPPPPPAPETPAPPPTVDYDEQPTPIPPPVKKRKRR